MHCMLILFLFGLVWFGLVWLITESRLGQYSFCWWVVLPMSSGWLILQGSDTELSRPEITTTR